MKISKIGKIEARTRFVYKGKITPCTIQGIKIKEEYESEPLLRRHPELASIKKKITYTASASLGEYIGLKEGTTLVSLEENELFPSKEAIVEHFTQQLL